MRGARTRELPRKDWGLVTQGLCTAGAQVQVKGLGLGSYSWLLWHCGIIVVITSAVTVHRRTQATGRIDPGDIEKFCIPLAALALMKKDLLHVSPDLLI